MGDGLQEGPRRIEWNCRTIQINIKRENVYGYHQQCQYSLQKKPNHSLKYNSKFIFFPRKFYIVPLSPQKTKKLIHF